MVEHLLAKEKVAGSIPVSRSPSRRRRQVVRLGSAKAACSGSNPLVASKNRRGTNVAHVFSSFLININPYHVHLDLCS